MEIHHSSIEIDGFSHDNHHGNRKSTIPSWRNSPHDGTPPWDAAMTQSGGSHIRAAGHHSAALRHDHPVGAGSGQWRDSIGSL